MTRVPPHLPRALSDFAGRWRLCRVITDRRAGHSSHFEGEARLTPAGGGLSYVEEGMLSLPGAPSLAASRRYLWRAADGEIAVDFADGRPFHAFAPGRRQARVVHDCAPDLYEGLYDFTGWPVWRVAWRVAGPRKDYTMRTVYSIAAG